jgi:transmembrane sensor
MTTPIHSNEQSRLQRLDEASQWLLRMQDPKRTDEQLNEWLHWIDADPENFAEFERLQRDWIDLNALKGDELALTPQQKSVLLDQENSHLANRYFTRRFGARRSAWALAAGLAVVALGAAVFQYVRTPSAAPAQQIAAALTSRAATLPDGSRMILGVQSRVNMDFNGSKRQLDLSSGEAYFKVKHDKARPFVVQAGEISVTAIGTAFDVRREHERVTITVEEGIVEVSSRESGKRPVTWRAEAGYQLTYSTRDRTASLASVNPAAELAWRDGELAYVREPLGSVVENLNRHSSRKIVIADPEIAALPFTGTAFASSLDDWLAGVEQAYPITARHTDNGDIILKPAK